MPNTKRKTEKPDGEKIQVHVQVTEDERTRIKVHAAENRMTITDLLRDRLADILAA